MGSTSPIRTLPAQHAIKQSNHNKFYSTIVNKRFPDYQFNHQVHNIKRQSNVQTLEVSHTNKATEKGLIKS